MLEVSDYALRQKLIAMGEAAISPMRRVMERGDSAARYAAVRVLWAIESPDAAATLCFALEDPHAPVRERAKAGLVRLGEPSVKPLAQCLKSRRIQTRLAAVEALAQVESPAVMQPLLKGLADDDPEISALACDALVRIGQPAVIGLCKALLDNRAYQPAQAALVEIGPPAVAWLRYLLGSSAPAVGARILETLLKMGDATALEALCDALDVIQMRPAVQVELIKLGKPAVRPLCQALRRQRTFVRSEAAEALGFIRDPDAAECLCRALQDKHEAVRSEAAWALGEIGDLTALPLLCSALSDPEVLVRTAAVAALGKLRQAEAVEPLCRALDDSSSEVRRSAAEALGEFGRREVLPLLRARLHTWGRERSLGVRAALDDAIRKIDKATAETRGLPRTGQAHVPEPSGLPRTVVDVPSPEGRPRSGPEIVN